MTIDSGDEYQPANIPRTWLIFGGLMLLASVTMYYSRWFVFEFAAAALIVSTAFFWGIYLLVNLVEYYRRTLWILTALPLTVILFGLSCYFLTFFLVFSPTRRCSLESLTVARCEDRYERYGNSVPEPLPCNWNQTHILGLVLIGDETDKQCGYGPYGP